MTGLNYICDPVGNAIFIYDSSWVLQLKARASSPQYLKVIDDNLYYSCSFPCNTLQRFIIYPNATANANLTVSIATAKSVPLQFVNYQAITYDAKSDLIYAVFGSYLGTFNRNLQNITFASIGDTSKGLAFYNNKAYIGLFYSTPMKIRVMQNNILIANYPLDCPTELSVNSISFDSYGNILVPCFSDQRILLYYPNGTYTKNYLQTNVRPTEVKLDSKGRLIVVGNKGIEIFY